MKTETALPEATSPLQAPAATTPPILSLSDGVALMAVYTDRFQPSDVIDRSVILHSMPDDLHSQPAGNSGARIACGVIQKI